LLKVALNTKTQSIRFSQNISTWIYLYFLNKALKYIGIENNLILIILILL
jgi:hypothetical protein